MDEHTLRVLEFDKILRMAAASAATMPGKALVEKIRPLRNSAEVREHSALVSECRNKVSAGRPFGIEHFDDLSPLFQKVRPHNALLAPFDLRSFLPLFYSALNLKTISSDLSCPGIGSKVSLLTTHGEIKKAIEGAVDREGHISDGASPGLSHIRKSIRSCETRIRKTLEGLLKQNSLAPHLQDHFLAERNNRWVIPVKIDSRGSVPGIVHDVSNTGETVYVEPYAIQQLGNELESYRAEEKLEEHRILRMLTSLLKEHLGEIEGDYTIVAHIDALQAIAVFSEQMAMVPPEINEKGYINIVRGKHPLLWKVFKKESREAGLVPLDLEIGRGHSCMVITGSNAGGKTVALKTIGVLSLMALCGMHTPAGPGTTFPFIRGVFADIGDEQSIEHNLSTFSAHMTRISHIVRQSSNDTMIIIDELGTGTDPEQGGALSCALLRKLKQRGAISLVSTHLGMVKAFAHAEAGMINSSMEMEEITVNNVTRYRPAYKLVMGEPGTSHAIEIAETLGLDRDIISEARGILAGEGAAIESLISDLKKKIRETDNRLKEIEKLRQEADKVRLKLHEELSDIQSTKKSVLSRSLREAEELLRQTKREAREIIGKIKKSTQEEAGQGIKNLDRKHDQIRQLQKLHTHEKIQPVRGVREGQPVFINVLNKIAVVHSVNEKTGRCKVLVEGKEIIVPLTELSEPSDGLINMRDVPGKGTGQAVPAYASGDSEREEELNVIGHRVDPALSRVERFLNDAALSGLSQLKIIHGIGAGILSRAIRDYVKDHPLVQSSRRGNEEEGGEAVTIVFL